jgi:DNA primase
MSTIDEIKARIDIVDLVSETVQLKRSGKSYTGFCPFHSNTRTPAFVVFPESGTWRCFGQCAEGGDVFGFVMKKEGLDFTEALRLLAEKAGVQLKVPTPFEQAAAEEHDLLRALLEEAVTFYRHQLLNTPSGKTALNYLYKRGLTDETIEVFGLGFAPPSWEATTGYFKTKGYSEDDLLETGLASARDGGEGSDLRQGVFDRFRNRIMFPIRDERGRMTGFGARILATEDMPKFLNSPQTPLFDKGHLLYGLERARKSIRGSDQAVLVEGYLDVIALHQAGFANAVSPMGTAITEHQLYLIKRFTRNIVLALDSDAAGDKATLRGLQVARQAMDREHEVVFDARGLMGHAARLQADIRVTTLPEGMDPDDVVKRDPEEWKRIIENARPIVVHVMEMAAVGRDLDDARVKTDIATQVLPLIEDLPNPIERDTYRQRLARLIRVDERTLTVGGMPQATRSRRKRPSSQAVPKPDLSQVSLQAVDEARACQTLEAHCLGVLMRRPGLLYRIDRHLQEAGLTRLSGDDFQRSDHKTIYRLIQSSTDQDEIEPLYYVLNRLSIPLMDVADRLLASTEKLDPNEDNVLEDVLRALLDLRRRSVRQTIDHLRFQLEDSAGEPAIHVKEYSQSVKQYADALNKINKAIGRYTNRAATPGG